ncbi:bifunctional 4-hydroxy-2-oxoglutarate aldolase/2-dehydro-3-deoxy-phosphogluconate aldolase [Spiractinospora alimapuensis]|uniref:bifunctional 4-hydroxy-2-oxoglutarate aldolase/2-dehydro-3-deoxy-phosphogluconate aldolase n=1 Tax=Spiractinospora alimapuensis TaxID=2820884 RepID=UPI001F1B7564|nr:bifunctional 4-hydroxy-2-oxoglutarate aldolase/2-dehydro-3-deoxy-phosphogluconate aldolase [Spiractinospora alimapuensis]
MSTTPVSLSDWPDFFVENLGDVPLVVILRGASPEEAAATARTAWEAGVGLVEVTVESEAGFPALEAVVEAAGDDHVVGAGTVTTPELLDRTVDAGARFGVAPGLDTDTVKAAIDRGIPFLPGIATPTEAGQALRLGVSTVKAFPANALGPKWISTVSGPFPRLSVIPTGGIGAHNAADYLAAGAVAVGVGSSITKGGGLADLVRTLRGA